MTRNGVSSSLCLLRKTLQCGINGGSRRVKKISPKALMSDFFFLIHHTRHFSPYFIEMKNRSLSLYTRLLLNHLKIVPVMFLSYSRMSCLILLFSPFKYLQDILHVFSISVRFRHGSHIRIGVCCFKPLKY